MMSSNPTLDGGKRIFIHVGVPKTGSSALQAFFSLQADLLERQGISYPFCEAKVTVTAGTCTGNLLHVMLKKASAEGFQSNLAGLTANYLPFALDAAVEAARCDTVLVSGEFITQHLTPALIDYFQTLSRRHRVTFIGFVRDVHDLTLSQWKQHVKAKAETRDLPVYVAAALEQGFFSLRKLCMLLNAGMDVRVRNYDTVRRDLVGALAAEIGFDSAKAGVWSQSSGQKNVSLSYWQAKAVILAQSTGSERLGAVLVNRFLNEHDRRRDPYFAHIDAELLQFLRADLALLNENLASGEQLRTTLRDGADESELGFPPDIVAKIIEALHQCAAPPIVQLTSAANPLLPKDFDPQVYLLRNPDVAAARMDPTYHYLNHGRFEGRAYKGTAGELG